MKSLARSQSCLLKQRQNKEQGLKKYPSHMRNKSLIQLKKRQANKEKTSKQYKEQIHAHIAKRADVEIISHYQQYKEQFFRKSKKLQDYLYTNPNVQQIYLSDNNSHFYRGFQYTLLSLFRTGILVPGSHTNMREEAIKQIQKWVLSWIQRQMLYEKVIDDQNQAIKSTLNVVKQIQQFATNLSNEKPYF